MKERREKIAFLLLILIVVLIIVITRTIIPFIPIGTETSGFFLKVGK